MHDNIIDRNGIFNSAAGGHCAPLKAKDKRKRNVKKIVFSVWTKRVTDSHVGSFNRIEFYVKLFEYLFLGYIQFYFLNVNYLNLWKLYVIRKCFISNWSCIKKNLLRSVYVYTIFYNFWILSLNSLEFSTGSRQFCHIDMI